jgi:hypothetical protein
MYVDPFSRLRFCHAYSYSGAENFLQAVQAFIA